MSLLFSYLFLENYRTIKGRSVSFDHRYRYDADGHTIKGESNQENAFGCFFYGKNVYSVTCLVGKNGEGKTSLVDFLRDGFALIKDDLDSEDPRMTVSGDGCIELTKEQAEYYHLEESTKFLVIFREDDIDYYITNIKGVKRDADIEAVCKAYPSGDKGRNPDYRIAYFSMMRFLTGVGEQERAYGRERDERLSENLYRFETILERYNIDFSEEEMNQRKERGRFSPGNMDLLMQLAFLDIDDKEFLKSILGQDYLNRLEISSIDIKGAFRDTKVKISDFDIKKGEQKSGAGPSPDEPERTSLAAIIMEDSTAYLRPFSSGQYSRFAFLARLYWYMGGGIKFWNTQLMKRIRDREERQKVSKSKAEWLKRARFNDESGILLIDEGELYYHPEWQRCFVSDVFRLIGKYSGPAKVQVVFTTSSTFMLSDILREDVVVLSEADREKLPYLDEDLQTFGQNIHMLLANRFFMDSSIGAGSERVIKELFKLLRVQKDEKGEDEDPDQCRKRVQDGITAYFKDYAEVHTAEFSSPDNVDDFIYRLIRSVGEEFYRRQLLEMFEEYRRHTRRLSGKLEKARQILENIKEPDATTKEVLELLTEIQKEGAL